MTRDEQIAALAAKWEAEATEMDAMQARNFNPHTASRIEEMHEKAGALRALLASPAALSSASATEAALRAEVERITRERDAERREADLYCKATDHLVAREAALRGERDEARLTAESERLTRKVLGKSSEASMARANAAEKERDEACEALGRLVERLDAVHAAPEYEAVWATAQLHRGPYTGPTYTTELDEGRAVLARIRKETPDHE